MSDATRQRWPAAKLAKALAVYPVIDLAHVLGGTLGDARGLLAAALRGGATMVQLREKGERFSELLRLCGECRGRLREAGAPLIINDRLDIALAAEADGVHLGQSDGSAAEARFRAGQAGRDDLIIGLSVSTVEEAQAALAGGADYLSLSPIFGTATKPDIARPAGLDGLRALRAAGPQTPICAIGGIKPPRVASIIAAGADGVAFVSALGTAPELAVRAMADAVVAAKAAQRAPSAPRDRENP